MPPTKMETNSTEMTKDTTCESKPIQKTKLRKCTKSKRIRRNVMKPIELAATT